MRIRLAIFCIFALVLACGPARAESNSYVSNATLDGTISDAGAVHTEATVLYVGDNAADEARRAFVSFDIDSHNATATVSSATLYLYFQGGVNFVLGFGNETMVHHMDYGASLDATDYSAAALDEEVGNATLGVAPLDYDLDWKTVDVTDQFKDDVANGRSRSQFRLVLGPNETDSDGNAEYVTIGAGEDDDRHPFLLVVTQDATASEIPTLTDAGLLLLFALLGLAAWRGQRRTAV